MQEMRDEQSPKMKIMVLARSARPTDIIGGAEKVLSTLSIALGDKVDFVFVFPFKNASSKYDFPYKGRYIELDLRWDEPAPTILHRVEIMFHKLKELRRAIREENPDVILSNSMTFWHHLIVALKLVRLTTKKVIVRFGTPVFVATTRRGKLYTLLMRLGMKRVDRVVAASQGLANELEKDLGVSPTKMTVINNPLSLTEIEALSQEEIHGSLFDDDLPIVLNVARLIPDQKNHSLLIGAFQKVQEHIDANLVLVGTGECEGQLRQLVHNRNLEKRVHFLGWQHNPFKYMRQADVFVLSSNYEGFPNVLLEAMACGCPIISTDCPYGPSEILDGGKYGVLVPVGDEEGLANEIMRVLRNQELRQTLAQKSKQRANEFNVEVIADQYARVFHQLTT